MASYERYTALPAAEVLKRAEEVLVSRLPIQRTAATGHTVTLSGGDGTVTFTAHRHGLDTQVLAETDQPRTSRLDNDVQYVMTLLAYQPDDVMPVRERP